MHYPYLDLHHHPRSQSQKKGSTTKPELDTAEEQSIPNTEVALEIHAFNTLSMTTSLEKIQGHCGILNRKLTLEPEKHPLGTFNDINYKGPVKGDAIGIQRKNR
ncbi:uncharacterized protein ACOB8E_017700 [Sarcophilus harrisii]